MRTTLIKIKNKVLRILYYIIGCVMSMILLFTLFAIPINWVSSFYGGDFNYTFLIMFFVSAFGTHYTDSKLYPRNNDNNTDNA